MLTNARIPKTTTVTLSPPDEIGMSTRRAGRGGIVLSSCVRRATFLVLVGLLPTCLARLSSTARIPSSDATASVAVVVDDMPISGILAHRQLKSSKSSKTKSSKTKSSKTKSSKTKKSDKKKKKKKSSIFNKNGDGSSKSKKKSSSSSKKKSSSSKVSAYVHSTSHFPHLFTLRKLINFAVSSHHCPTFSISKS